MIIKSQSAGRLHLAKSIRLLALYGSAAVLSANALAQAPSAEDAAENGMIEEIIVTGTLIRGVSPIGTSPLTIDEDDIKLTGATSTNAILATVPQISNAFNTNAANPTTDAGSTTFRPNIRNLGAAGGNTTLVMINGHNVVGAGVMQTTPAADVIPPGMLQRVEVLADGGSSLYGADAVGGIVNYITKRRQEGIRVDAAYGYTEDGYRSDSLNITMGHDWSSGSGVLSILTRSNDALEVNDRKLPRQDLRRWGGDDYRSTACATPNFSVGTDSYRYEGGAFLPGSERCESDYYASIMPEERQDAIYGSLTQELSSWIDLDVTAYYSDRETNGRLAPLTADSLGIPDSNFYFTPVGTETEQSASFSYGPALGNALKLTNELKTWAITPTLTFSLANDWQVKATYNYGWSETISVKGGINPLEQILAAGGTTADTALNPYDIAATDPAVLARLTDWLDYGENEQTLSDTRIIADGPLFELPGGTARVAVGAQYQRQDIKPMILTGTRADVSAARPNEADRTVKSAFAQLVVPVIGSGNSIPFVQHLELDISARYDDYSDFGDTTNPRLGFSWGINDSFSVRGNIGSSFNAPSLVDNTSIPQVQRVPVALFQGGPNYNFPMDLLRPTIILAGSDPDMRPQEADTWSLGFDWNSQSIEGLSAGLGYWNIELEDIISVVAPGFLGDPFNPRYADSLIENPTRAQLEAAIAAANPSNPNFVDLDAHYAIPGVTSPYLYLDLRVKNYGGLDTSGVDFYLNYSRAVSWGLVFAQVNGTHTLTRDYLGAGGSALDLTKVGFSDLQASTTLGTTWNGLLASVTANYSEGYDVEGAGSQESVGSYTLVNAAFAYDFQGSGLTENLTASLNVNNLFNKYPPFFNQSGGTANGQTLGRLITVGVTKQF